MTQGVYTRFPKKIIDSRKKCTKCNLIKNLTEFGRKQYVHFLGYKSECKQCNRDRVNKWEKDNPEKFNENSRLYNYRKKIKVFEHYSKGIPHCNCCNEKEIMFLSVDHINNDGSKHRKEIGGKISHWLIRNNFPLGFQILCHNCNQGRRMNKGVCPHKELKKI